MIASGVLSFVALIAGLFIYSKWANAGSANLYPGNCLGTWQNPDKAQGRPDSSILEGGQESNLITKENSTVFSEGGIKEIYCGSFNGDLSENEIKLIKSVNLKFSWLVTDEELTTATSSIIIIQPPATSSEEVVQNTDYIVNQILNNINADEVQLIISTTTPEIMITTDSIQPSPEATAGTASSPQASEIENVAAIGNSAEIINEQPEITAPTPEVATSSPTSFWWRKFSFFFAEDQVPNTGITNNELGIMNQTATSSLNNPLSLTGDFLKVSYTLDGVNWQELGMVNKNNWQNASFEISVYQLEDIKKIQIKIESLPIVNKTPFVYLDGMALEVDYETSQTFQSKTASILSQLSNHDVSYSRTPSGSSITGPVSISVSVDSLDDLGIGSGCGLNSQSCDFWGVRVTNSDNDSFNSECVSNETLSHTFTFDLPAASYIEVMAYAGHTQESCGQGGEMSNFLERDNSEKIFTVMEQ